MERKFLGADPALKVEKVTLSHEMQRLQIRVSQLHEFSMIFF